MQQQKVILKKISRHVDRFSDLDITSLSEEEQQEEKDFCETEIKLFEQIYGLPEEKALAILDKMEEQDDYIASLEKAEKEIKPSINVIQELCLHLENTGWFYPDNDD